MQVFLQVFQAQPRDVEQGIVQRAPLDQPLAFGFQSLEIGALPLHPGVEKFGLRNLGTVQVWRSIRRMALRQQFVQRTPGLLDFSGKAGEAHSS